MKSYMRKEYKLPELFDMHMGKTPDRNNSEYWENGTNPWISIADMTSNGKLITHTKEYITDRAIRETGIKPINYNTVIMSFKLSVGKVSKVATKDCPAYSNEAIMAFEIPSVPLGSPMILNDYAYYLLQSIDFTNTGNKAVMGKTLNKAILQNTAVKIHVDLDVQSEIITVLDKITDLIDRRKEQLEKLDELVKARFVELFGDPIINSKNLETRELKDFLVLKAGDFTAASDISDEPTDANPYPCYGGNGIRGYVSEYNQEGEYSLVGRQGALSGNVQFARGKFKNTEHALLVIPMVEVNNIWLNQLLLNLDLKRYQTGAAQPGLSVKNLQEIPIIVVPIDAQNEFAAFVKQTDKSKLEVQKSLEKLELLKNALMQKYFG